MKYKKYTMDAASEVAKAATHDIEAFLKKNEHTISVLNVENDITYQQKDIDLIWICWNKSKTATKRVTIEIKGDRYHHTGNYFFETISNEAKDTPGCFLYTEADYVFYYFIGIKELHILPMPATRDWFLRNIDQFRETKTSTPVGKGRYVTVGRLVPRQLVRGAIPKVKIRSLK